MNATFSTSGPTVSLIPMSILSSLGLGLGVLVGLPVIAIVINVLRQLLIPQDPSLPPEVFHLIPIFGSAAAYGNDPLGFFFKCREKYGDVFTFVLMGRKMTVALGPKGNNFILGSKISQVSAEEAYTNLMTPIFGKGVAYDVPNHVFMEQKRFLKMSLTPDHFKAYVPMIENEVESFLNDDPAFSTYQTGKTDTWGRFHAFDVLSQITILTASRTLQGKEVRSNMDKSFADLYHDLDGGLTPLNFLFPNLPLPSYRRRDRAHIKMSNFYVDIVEKRAAEGHEEGGWDMIEALMNQSYKDGRPLTNREVGHLMIGLLMAGQHTSSASSSWALLHLSAHPEIAEALYQEQVKAFGRPDGTLRPMEHDDLKNLPLLDAVIRETLRIHPPIHSLIRKVISPIDVPASLAAPSKDSTYQVPKGYFLLSSPAVSQVDPLVWKNASEWAPYRWFDADGVAAEEYKKYTDGTGDKVDYGFGAISKGTESQYLPFGAGRHRCIGEQFAYLQVGTIIATIVRKLEMKIEKHVPDHNYNTMIVLPKEPGGILYRRRA